MSVIVCHRERNTLLELLRKNCGLSTLQELQIGALRIHALSTECMLLSGTLPPNLRGEAAVFIVRKAENLPVNFSCSRCVAITNSANPSAKEAVAAAHLPALTCGLSGADTFTFSSITQDSALLCLRRSIDALDTTVIDPFELPICFSQPVDSFDLLACAAVFCLLGAQNPLKAKKIWTLKQ